MARIISALLHRPHVDKAKRAARIPVGGHTEETLRRSQPEVVVVAPDKIAEFAESFEGEVVGSEVPFTEDLVSEAPEGDLVVDEPVAEGPRVGDEFIVNDLLTIIEKQAAEDEAEPVAEVIEEEVVLHSESEDVVAEEEHAPAGEEPVAVAAVEEIVVEEIVVEAPVLEKFDYEAFLSQKPGEIKAALATGDHDHHLDALTEHETAGSARKTVLAHIAGRVKV
jgi:hypothetical protein